MVIYSKYNIHRKEEFRLLTTIEKDGNNLFSSKIANNAKAEAFLASFFEKYIFLKENNFSFHLVEPKKVNDRKMIFEYKKGETLDSLLFELFQGSKKGEFIALLKEYEKLLKNNEIKNENLNTEFKKIFGGDDEMKFDCVQLGCVDLNFDNIIVDTLTKEFYVIDYEWTFTFPVPYKYVIFRALTAFFGNYFYYNFNKSFISLSELYKIFGITEEEKNVFIVFEYNFQKYVLNSYNVSQTEYKENYSSLEAGYHFSDYFGNQEMQQKDQEITSLNRTIQQKDQEIINLNQAIQYKDLEVMVMQESKFWKLRKLYLRFKNYGKH